MREEVALQEMDVYRTPLVTYESQKIINRKKRMTNNDSFFWGSIVVIVIALVIGVFIAFNEAISKGEISECEKWQNQAVVFTRGFYLTKWQADQCEAHGIEVNAPVR